LGVGLGGWWAEGMRGMWCWVLVVEVVACTIDDTAQVGEWFLVVVVPASMGYYLTQIFVTRFLLL